LPTLLKFETYTAIKHHGGLTMPKWLDVCATLSHRT